VVHSTVSVLTVLVLLSFWALRVVTAARR